MNGPTDFNYITPEEAAAMGPETVEYYKTLARKSVRCSVCRQPAWKYADTGLCFPCTTGESDASDDYELLPQEGKG
jgi:hypothetical protein